MSALSFPLSSNPNKPVTVEIPEQSDAPLSQHDLEVWHQVYDCPLHTWLSVASVRSGRQAVRQTYLLYVEYRDHRHASSYQEYQFDSLSPALEFQRNQVKLLEIRNISPVQTRRFPIKQWPESPGYDMP